METKTLNKLAHLQYPVGKTILVKHPEYKQQSWLYKVDEKSENVIILKRISVMKNGETVHFKNCHITVDSSWFEKESKRIIEILP